MVKAQKAGPNEIEASPATFTSATDVPTIKISAMDQGLSRSANKKARRETGRGRRFRTSGLTAVMIAPRRSNGKKMMNAAVATASGKEKVSENAMTADSTVVLLACPLTVRSRKGKLIAAIIKTKDATARLRTLAMAEPRSRCITAPHMAQ